jgi:hydroxyacyl-ACP dehydratase HTD2-like protein with hotdog domain
MTPAATRHSVSRSGIRHFALAIGASNPIHHSVDYARAHGYRDVVAPSNFYSAIALSLGRELPASQLRADGLAQSDELVGRVVAGGCALRWQGAICAGDEISVVEEHLPPRTRQGRHGPLVIHSVRRRYYADDRLVLEEQADRIGIPVGRTDSTALPLSATAGKEVAAAELRVNELDLFMFCAATWLTHRIHFDRDYARSEGYSDLVIPGPLQCARLGQLVADFAAAHGGRLDYLEVRHRSPAICGTPIRMAASIADAEIGPDSVSAKLNVSVTGPDGLVYTSGRSEVTLARSPSVLALVREHCVAP